MIEKYGGLIWPRGHQDQLRAAESAWKTATVSTRAAGDQISSAKSLIDAQQSPETGDAAKKHEDLKKDFDTIADAFSGLGDACGQYAQFIDDAHHNLIQMLKDMLRDTIIMEVIGAVAGALSFGIGEGIAQLAVAGRIMMYVERAREILTALVNAVKRVIQPLVKLFGKLGAVLERLGAAIKQAVSRVGSKLGLGKKTEEVAQADIRVSISHSKYPESTQHIQDAIASGQPKVLTINRGGAAANRRASLEGFPTKKGFDRDEYPPAMSQEGGSGASVRHINPGDNRGSGATIGRQLRDFPDGTTYEIGLDL